MTAEGPGPVAVVVARDEIHQLVCRYSSALERHDVDAMVSLFHPEARFGPWGTGPEALRRLTTTALVGAQVTVVMVANHVIEVTSEAEANGEVWARAFTRTAADGYVEQLIRYRDRYRVHDGAWRFLHRKHQLWFGLSPALDPFDQPEACWPEHQVGVGDICFDWAPFAEWWASRGHA